MSVRVLAVLLLAALAASTVVQRGFVEAVDEDREVGPDLMTRTLDAASEAAELGIPQAEGFAFAAAELGFRVRYLVNGEVVIDGAPGSAFQPGSRGEESVELQGRGEALAVINALAGPAGPPESTSEALKSDLSDALWLGAAVFGIPCVVLILVTLRRRRTGGTHD